MIKLALTRVEGDRIQILNSVNLGPLCIPHTNFHPPFHSLKGRIFKTLEHVFTYF